MSHPPQFVAGDTEAREALTRMMKQRISSLFVPLRNPEQTPGPRTECGIVTERDLLRAIAEHQAAALAMPVERFASRPLVAVPAQAFVYRAVGRMHRLKTRHLGVVDETNRIIGAISARDLLRQRAGEAVMLGDEIDQAGDVPALATAWAKVAQVASSLLAEGLGGRDIAAVISREIGALTREPSLSRNGACWNPVTGAPPSPYAFAVLGSAGRGESLLAMDQDNALVFAEGEPDGAEDKWFGLMATHVADVLHESACPIARAASWPKTRNGAARQRPGTPALPDGSIAPDRRTCWPSTFSSTCAAFMATPSWRTGCGATASTPREGRPVLPSFSPRREARSSRRSAGSGGSRPIQGRIDLKRTGLFGIVTAARALAIRHHVVERSTPARLAGVKALGLGAESEFSDLDEAQAVFLDLILAQQLDDIEHGRPATNAIVVKRLSRAQRARLRAALEPLEHLDEWVRDLLFKN